MRLVDEEPIQTFHLYVVPENELPPKQDHSALIILTLCVLFIMGVIALSLLAPTPDHEVSFSLSIQGYYLAPVSKTMHISVQATGNVSVAATAATGTITFYNGTIYTQIIPVGTILKGSDGVSVITDAQAILPPAVQTTPPTYGQTSVVAHALISGQAGNIAGGDINEACCVTSVIAQNPYSFSGGRNAYRYTYLTVQDVKNATDPVIPAVQQQALSLFTTSSVLDPTCATSVRSNRAIGQRTKTALVTFTVTCKAISYSLKSTFTAIDIYKKNLGVGTLTHVIYQIVGVEKGVIRLYVTAMWNPMLVRHFLAK